MSSGFVLASARRTTTICSRKPLVRHVLHVCMAATPSLGTAEDSDDIARNDRRLSKASFDLNLEHHERDTVEK